MSSEGKYHIIEHHKVSMPELDVDGFVLDIGGGGEGIIGQILGKQVIAIDRLRDELEETHNDALKLVMDARELAFVDNSFAAVTVFFTLMYISSEDHVKVLTEALRVLKPGGALYIWDVSITPWNGESDAYIVPLTVVLPCGKEINVSYGVGWPGRQQDMVSLQQLATSLGFETLESASSGMVFRLTLRKPLS